MGPQMLLCPQVQLLCSSKSSSKHRPDALSSSSTATTNGNARNCVSVQSSLKMPSFLNQPVSIYGKSRRHGSAFPSRKGCVAVASTGSEVSVEEPVTETEVPPEEPPQTLVLDSDAEPKPRKSGARSPRTIIVSQEQLVTGATFPGKVTAIQPFGAFVDLGAFTNGLVHISRLSKSFVKNVEDVVQLGQDVNVQILDVDFKTNRISLMLVEEETEEDAQSGEGEGGASPKSGSEQGGGRTGRRDGSSRRPRQQAAPATKYKKGEIVTGTVKNMIRSGVFLSLPDGTDGYLPVSEVIFKGPNTKLEGHFQTGQEVPVRVLRIDRGRVTLTTKQEVDFDKINADLNKDVIGGATNPFEIAFRRNEAIASYLAEKEKLKAETESSSEKDEEESTSEEQKEELTSKEATSEVVEEATEAAVASEGIDAKEQDEKATVEEDELTSKVDTTAAAEATEVQEEPEPVQEEAEAVSGTINQEETDVLPSEVVSSNSVQS